MSRGSPFLKLPTEQYIFSGLGALSPIGMPASLLFTAAGTLMPTPRKQIFWAIGTSEARKPAGKNTLNLGLVKTYTHELLDNAASHWNVRAKFCVQCLRLRLAASRISFPFVLVAKTFYLWSLLWLLWKAKCSQKSAKELLFVKWQLPLCREKNYWWLSAGASWSPWSVEQCDSGLETGPDLPGISSH